MSRPAKVNLDRRYEILGVLLLAVTTLLFLALVTDGHQGEVRRSLDGIAEVSNALGRPGAAVAGFLYILLGHAAHALYFVTCVWGMMLIRHRPLDRLTGRLVGLLLLIFSLAGLLHVDFAVPGERAIPGGAIGAFAGNLVEPTFGIIGANVITVTLATVGILLATEFLFMRVFATVQNFAILILRTVAELCRRLAAYWRATRKLAHDRRTKRSMYARQARWREDAQEPAFSGYSPDDAAPWPADPDDLSRIRIRPEPSGPVEPEPDAPFSAIPAVDGMAAHGAPQGPKPSVPQDLAPRSDGQLDLLREEGTATARQPIKLASDTAAFPRRRTGAVDAPPPDHVYPKRYAKPSIDLFDKPPKPVVPDLGESLRKISVLLEERLATFGIEAQVTDVTRGPTITRYELEPAPGVKVSRFQSLADDLALALKAHRVRVVAPIPGKGRVGVEVPNLDREPVVVRDLLESKAFRDHEGQLPLALGKDIPGDVVVADLAAMPHLLVAGVTGAGKTVCVKAFLASLVFNKTPEELQLMLIDPKMVELSVFNDIPHLITPVVTDPKKAASALNWLIVEMEERYQLLAHLRVRNIEVYNKSVENGEIEIPAREGDGAHAVSVIRKLPYIVCVIDELADLMMLARAEVEDAIARLAQLARAVGIHLIIATQRPSVDVLTGVIKANFPVRISFQVSSRVDSRCILDEIGAERLIGKGDMLFLPAGQSRPTRIQGAFVSDEETNLLVSYLKTQAPPQYRDEIKNFGQSKERLDGLAEETDELFDDAVRVVLETGQASISMVQRRLRVGYTRAARLIDMMELRGIVGPHTGSKARDILVDLPSTDEVA